ncbi:MAG: hypothetical protein IPG82_19525 [Saprospiraceae bacterium]|nr:hypothetical protein [Saprospiraceae bacterium]
MASVTGHAPVIIQMVSDDIATAPTTGYVTDNATSLKGYLQALAKDGIYDGQAMVIRPTAGKILIRTADNKYAKMEIISYYKDVPATLTLDTCEVLYI